MPNFFNLFQLKGHSHSVVVGIAELRVHRPQAGHLDVVGNQEAVNGDGEADAGGIGDVGVAGGVGEGCLFLLLEEVKGHADALRQGRTVDKVSPVHGQVSVTLGLHVVVVVAAGDDVIALVVLLGHIGGEHLHLTVTDSGIGAVSGHMQGINHQLIAGFRFDSLLGIAAIQIEEFVEAGLNGEAAADCAVHHGETGEAGDTGLALADGLIHRIEEIGRVIVHGEGVPVVLERL